jgi:hypothetical protein
MNPRRVVPLVVQVLVRRVPMASAPRPENVCGKGVRESSRRMRIVDTPG